jgi:hypothetical protein
MPPRMIVAVETIREENIRVSPVLPNSSAGARIWTWISANRRKSWLNNPLIIPKNAMAT